MSEDLQPPTRLSRRLGIVDAVVIGLGSMIGAGVFAAFAPAARAAGNSLPIGLAVAAFVAYCNATSSAQLAAVSPESGGSCVYGRVRLGPFWGFLAGWGFVVGRLASCAAMAMTFAHYVATSATRTLAVAAVVTVTSVNYLGVKKTALLTKAIVATVLVSLALAIGAVWLGGSADPGRLLPLTDASVYSVLQSAGFLFFAFAGYARLAALGEEVIDPTHTIPRAIPIALAITLLVYAAVGVSALAGAGASAIAASSAPLATAVEGGRLAWLSPAVSIGAAIASLGALLSLTVGVSRTAFAMASNRDLPAFLAAVHRRHRVPHRAEIAVGVVVATVTMTADVRSAIGFSSFAVLVYYAIANAAAWTLDGSQRTRPRGLAVLGFSGCAALAATLPLTSVFEGSAVLAVGALVYTLRDRNLRRNPMDTVRIRYIVDDVETAIAFYTQHFGFRVDMHPGPGFAMLSRGALRLLLNTPTGGGGAAQPMADGRRPAPGGWNRIQLEVENLTELVRALGTAGVNFRNEIVTGNGGKQILADDSAGNPIELFEAFAKGSQLRS